MATKYHINKEGLPAVCRASKNPCPMGGEHYESKLDALAAADEKAREDGFFMQSAKKNVVFHVNEKGAVEECPYRDGYCEVSPYGKFANVHSHQREVIEGAAGVLREQVGATDRPPQSEVNISKPSSMNAQEDPLADWEREVLSGDAAKAANTASSTHTPEVIALKGNSDDRFRYAGWSEAEINDYQGSCGHSFPTGRSHVPWDYKGPAIPEGVAGNMTKQVLADRRLKAKKEKRDREAAARRTAAARKIRGGDLCG